MQGESKETKKQNTKRQSVAVAILIIVFWLQLPFAHFEWLKHPQLTDNKIKKSDIMKTENLRQSEKQASKSAQKTRSDDAWQLILVNGDHPLPMDFTVDLVKVQGDYKVDYRIAPAVRQMIADAQKDGVQLKICSAFRTVDRQDGLYNKKVNNYINTGTGQNQAKATAATIVAKAGESEHHTGLAMDIVTPSYQKLDEGFANTAAFSWLSKYAQNYGLILRYPKGKQGITGIIYEPWHYRYVGVENAKAMKAKNVCLEEYATLQK